MIEIVDEARCTACNICVQACPTNVFEARPDAPPVIARQADCQTCFMCELYCPEDALYVAANANAPVPGDQLPPAGSGVMGSYRRAVGWTKDTRERRAVDRSFVLTSPH